MKRNLSSDRGKLPYGESLPRSSGRWTKCSVESEGEPGNTEAVLGLNEGKAASKTKPEMTAPVTIQPRRIPRGGRWGGLTESDALPIVDVVDVVERGDEALGLSRVGETEPWRLDVSQAGLG